MSNIYFTWLHKAARVWLALLLALWAVVVPVTLLWAQLPTPTPSLPAATQEPTSLLTEEQRDADLDARVEQYLAQMDVADRVGQLFLLNFRGSETDISSDIALLIHAYRIGAVQLSPQYHNFDNNKGSDTPVRVATLANQLQALAYGFLLPADGSLPDAEMLGAVTEDLTPLAAVATEADRPPLNIPLFIAVEQAGDDLFATSLRRGFTELPNQLAVGATWDPELARDIGDVVGRELRAVGVNMLLGPSLDVMEQPRPDSVGRLGVHSFGGNPFWTSEIGSAYIAGVHQGSENSVAVMARHFPGQGAVDRLPDEEIATIQSSLDELRTVSLPPFKTVTDVSMDPGADQTGIADGLISSHMRYSGWQAIGPEMTTPLSLAPELATVLADEGMADWRQGGGLMMSNALGVPAIRRYYDDQSSEGFPYRRAALDAFTAGNDLIYLGQFGLDGDWETARVNIEATISFFQERYKNDLDFAAHVDDSVRKILRSKLRLFGDPSDLTLDELVETESISVTGSISAGVQVANRGPLVPLEKILKSAADLALLDEESESRLQANSATRQVARESISVLYPDPAELPPAPQVDDQLLVFTDSRLTQECDDCFAEVAVGPEEIAGIIESFYGAQATGQLTTGQVVSRAFADLAELLDADQDSAVESGADASANNGEGEAAASAEGNGDLATSVEGTEAGEPEPDKNARTQLLIDESTWLIFAMLDVDPENYPSSNVVKRFLRERNEELQDKRVVVLALNAPYFLDATEISKLTAYFGIYSRSQPFLENAVRAIFRTYTPTGSPPVSVPGTRFNNLAERLSPEPSKIIPLQVVVGEGEYVIDGISESDVSPEITAGDMIRVQVGPILDRNGWIVPDDTAVQFQLIYEGEELVLNVEPALTVGGMAARDIKLEQDGLLRVAAASGQATTGEAINLLVRVPELVPEPDVAPTAGAALGSAADVTVSASADQATSASVEDASLEMEVPPGRLSRLVGIETFVMVIVVILVTLSFLVIMQVRVLPRATLVKNVLWTAIIGLGTYIAYGVNLIPGSRVLYSEYDSWVVGVIVFVGMMASLLWLQLRPE